mmetsp:Transcript_2819/g.5361  ORF Transcript_2819/g.5361 Transcript_2819/m.5361 type:complete len:179 (+) Transcript_2819:926-1462(+)
MIDKIFEYELFGNFKLFFQKKKCKYISMIILSGEKIIRSDLKLIIYKIIKSYLNIIDYQFLLYGSGYSEIFISKYLLKSFFSELYISPVIINIYIETLLYLPKILLKNTNLHIEYFLKLSNYFNTDNNTYVINIKKNCFSLVKYTYCFESLINKEFLYNIIMLIIREFTSLNSLVIFF